MEPLAVNDDLAELCSRLDRATAADDPHAIGQAVKEVLIDAVNAHPGMVHEPFLRPAPDHYARRLMHRCPAGKYSIVAMVWDVGQGTPLHDHAGVWCVECVYQGKIRVTSYDLEGRTGDEFAFRPVENVVARPGDAGALIPPFEYHTIDNPYDEKAVTLHVYGGEMTWCHAFEPTGDGRYLKRRKELSYTA